MKDGSIRELDLTVEARILPLFFRFLQDGFQLQVQVGCSISEFLRDRCQLSHETITNRISTVFLDGQPVDDLNIALIVHDSTLALSGAMPGLAGAVMRSRSPLRSFRSSITHLGDDSIAHQESGLIRLKLFNTVIGELGISMLREGILLEPAAVTGFLEKNTAEIRSRITEMLLDGKPTHTEAVVGMDKLTGCGLVSLTVQAQE